MYVDKLYARYRDAGNTVWTLPNLITPSLFYHFFTNVFTPFLLTKLKFSRIRVREVFS